MIYVLLLNRIYFLAVFCSHKSYIMKKYLHLLFVAISCTANAQVDWRLHWQDEGFDAIVCNEELVIGGGDDFAFVSTDTGYCFLPNETEVYNIAILKMAAGDTVYAMTYNGFVHRSTDAGQTWSSMGSLAGAPARGMYWADGMHGIVAANNVVKVSTNGGANFINSGSGRMVDFVSIGQDVYLGVGTYNNNAPLIATYDATTTGQTTIWDDALITGLKCIERIDATTLYVFTNSGYRLISTDNGANFTSTASTTDGSTPAAILDVHFWDANNGVAIIGAEIHRTSDAGITWTLQNELLSEPADWCFDASGKGYLVQGGTLYRTTDHGQSWSQQAGHIYTDFLNIEFENEYRGVACGEDGMIRITHDGGNNWFDPEIDFPPTDDMHDVAWADNDNGIICGSKTFKTSDGGRTLTQVDIGTGGTYSNAVHLSGTYIIQTTFTNRISTDGGSNWNAINGIPGILATNGTDFFASDNTGVSTSTDNGQNWTVIDAGVNAEVDLFFLDANVGFAVGTNTWRTLDGGVNWTDMGAIGYSISSVHFMSQSVGYAFYRYSDDMYYTLDGGANWTVVLDHNFGTVQDVFFNSASTGVVVTSSGGGMQVAGDICAFVNGNGNPTGMSDIASETKELILYPNPVSNTLKVKGMEIGDAFEIHSIAGRIIANDTWTGSIDVEFLKSGLYLFVAMKNDQSRSIRFVKN